MNSWLPPLRFCLLVGLASLCTDTAIAESIGVPIRFNLDREGKVSVGVYNDAGQLIRRLHVGDDMPAGQHTVIWDGLDEQGKPVATGAYQWRLVNSPGLKAQYLTSLGTSNGYWHWPGAHEGPGSVEVIGDTAIMTANLVEGSPQWVAFDLKTGKVKWYQTPASGFGWISDISAGGKQIYASGFGQGEGELLVLNHDGKWVNSWSNWQRKILTWLPVRRLDLGGTGDDLDYQIPVEIEKFDEARGHGWDDTEGIARMRIGDRTAHASSERRSATFRASDAAPRFASKWSRATCTGRRRQSAIQPTGRVRSR